MSFAHEAVASWPTPGTGDPDRGLIRAMTTRRFAYCLSADEAASDFTAKDPDTGVPPLYLIQNGTLFAYDETDSTTAGDGVTCLVTDDDCRYKSETIAPPWSVLDKDLTAQPVSPSDGDRYLIPTAATGTDWAGKDGKIGIFKGARWHFAVVPIGRFLYVEDETAFYHRNTSGVWTAGVGSIAIGANSLNITNMLGAKASFVIKVENQTTNAPPVSPVVPTAYIIGPSPTGAWAGLAGKLAICLTAGSFTIITPVAGDEVYDKARGANFRFNGTAWVSSAGAWLDFVDSGFTQGTGSTSAFAGGRYTYSTTSAPGYTAGPSSNFRDDVGVIYTARYIGQKLRIKWSGIVTGDQNTNHVMALQVDNLASTVSWFITPLHANGRWSGVLETIITAADTTSHTYRWLAYPQTNTSTIEHRRTTLEGSS